MDRRLTTMKLPEGLLGELSRIALRENKSRVLLIQEILEDYVESYNESVSVRKSK